MALFHERVRRGPVIVANLPAGPAGVPAFSGGLELLASHELHDDCRRARCPELSNPGNRTAEYTAGTPTTWRKMIRPGRILPRRGRPGSSELPRRQSPRRR